MAGLLDEAVDRAYFIGAYWAPPYQCTDCHVRAHACMCELCSSPYAMDLWTRHRLFLCHSCAVQGQLKARAQAKVTVERFLGNEGKMDKKVKKVTQARDQKDKKDKKVKKDKKDKKDKKGTKKGG